MNVLVDYRLLQARCFGKASFFFQSDQSRIFTSQEQFEFVIIIIIIMTWEGNSTSILRFGEILTWNKSVSDIIYNIASVECEESTSCDITHWFFFPPLSFPPSSPHISLSACHPSTHPLWMKRTQTHTQSQHMHTHSKRRSMLYGVGSWHFSAHHACTHAKTESCIDSYKKKEKSPNERLFFLIFCLVYTINHTCAGLRNIWFPALTFCHSALHVCMNHWVDSVLI